MIAATFSHDLSLLLGGFVAALVLMLLWSASTASEEDEVPPRQDAWTVRRVEAPYDWAVQCPELRDKFYLSLQESAAKKVRHEC